MQLHFGCISVFTPRWKHITEQPDPQPAAPTAVPPGPLQAPAIPEKAVDIPQAPRYPVLSRRPG